MVRVQERELNSQGESYKLDNIFPRFYILFFLNTQGTLYLV